ncbi:hypothetical protein NHX12_017552 [Muraenolepis orangiensis]|uniref:phospholipase A2 n=1 Tax=Muraenolepis orangiensis TaxID=630683 RepID=A0A9Q0IXA4_9TELE|nr:hypothetical protein NHX12_017552 [Muraenolepis orangiensis]
MLLLGRLIGTVSSVSNLFPNPYRVKEVPLADYDGRGKVRLREEGRMVLYRDQACKSWDCVLVCPEYPTVAIRLFQVSEEVEAFDWFQQYALKLRPFYETLLLKAENIQPIVDCLRSHRDWSSAHIAVDRGLRECLKHNYIQSQINSRNASGQTPLHVACERGDVVCVRELLEESQARSDITDHDGDTPMHCAAKQERADVVEVLCLRMCNGVNELNKVGETPLHVACRLGRTEAIAALLAGGARCDVAGASGYPIHSAMKYSEKGCASALLTADPGQLHAEDPVYGGSPLHWSKNDEMCRMLLEQGCEVNYLSKTGESALHISTRRGRFEVAMVLLTHEADANLKGQGGNTALHLAMKMDRMDLIKALIVFGADMEIHNDLGETPGLIAARTSKGPNRKILLDMICSMGVQRCHPPTPSSPPAATPSAPVIGFEDLMHVAATVGAMSQGVDGGKTRKRKADRLLCLDGGGIKGLVLIQLLIALEREAGRPTRELFDWVSGTSTGGILALAIIHGKSMQYLRCLYFRMKEQVFNGSRPYESEPLEDFLKKEFGENTKMSDVRYPRVMVTSVLADRHPGELHIFRNYDTPSLARTPPYASTATFKSLAIPQEQLVWRAARSSGAAPTYFRPMGRFLDGGLLSNNPTLDAMTEVHQYNKALKAEGSRSPEAGYCGLPWNWQASPGGCWLCGCVPALQPPRAGQEHHGSQGAVQDAGGLLYRLGWLCGRQSHSLV